MNSSSPAAAMRRHAGNNAVRVPSLARRALKSSGYRALSRLTCDVVDGDTVVLSGVVPSFHMKQMAQAVILRLQVASRIENRVVVQES